MKKIPENHNDPKDIVDILDGLEPLSDAIGQTHAPQNLKMRTLKAMKAARDEQVHEGDEVDGGNPGQCDDRADAETLREINTAASEAHIVNYPSAKRPRTKRKRSRRIAVAAALCCALVLGGGSGFNLYSTPTAAIALEASTQVAGELNGGETVTGIELTVNRWNYVVGATAQGEDAQALLNSCSIMHLTYDEAVDILLDKAYGQGVFTDATTVSASVKCDNATQYNSIDATTQTCLASHGNGQGAHDGSGAGSGNGTGSHDGSGYGATSDNGSHDGSGHGAGNGKGAQG